MPPVFFKDLGKTGKDLLAKKYPANFELTEETKIQKDGDWTATQKGVIKRNGDNEFSGSFNPKFNLKSSGVSLSATVHTDNKLQLETSTEKLANGLKSILKVTAPSLTQLGSGKDAQQVRAEFEYKQEKVAATVGIDLLNEKPTASISAVSAKDKLQGGVDATWSLGSAPDLKSLALALGYSGDNWQATLSRTAKEGASGKVNYGVNVYQKVDDKLQIGAQVSFDASAEKAAPTLLFGGQYKLADASVKAKCGSNGRLGVAYAQEVNYFTRVTVGLDLNTADSKDHNLGLLVELHE